MSMRNTAAQSKETIRSSVHLVSAVYNDDFDHWVNIVLPATISIHKNITLPLHFELMSAIFPKLLILTTRR